MRRCRHGDVVEDADDGGACDLDPGRLHVIQRLVKGVRKITLAQPTERSRIREVEMKPEKPATWRTRRREEGRRFIGGGWTGSKW